MTKDVTIKYDLIDGTGVKVRLHQVGQRREWVLDLYMDRCEGLLPVHQHAIDGEPEVTVR